MVVIVLVVILEVELILRVGSDLQVRDKVIGEHRVIDGIIVQGEQFRVGEHVEEIGCVGRLECDVFRSFAFILVEDFVAGIIAVEDVQLIVVLEFGRLVLRAIAEENRVLAVLSQLEKCIEVQGFNDVA